jgi:[FeFe] hydrogenase (group B1/B3)
MTLNNNASRLKREILVKVAALAFEGRLEEGADRIPLELAPRGSTPHRCCLFHDREIIKYRILAQLGFSAEAIGDYDDPIKLGAYAKKALEREEVGPPFFSVLDEACNACVRTHYLVTNACQGCVARPCSTNCPKRAIHFEAGKAVIEPDPCVNCGICAKVCPYHAVIRIPVPCEEACPVDAIKKDEAGRERIDFEKCVFCGACMRECPFGAVVDRSQMVDVIVSMRGGETVVALFAPALAAQFRSGIPKLGAALVALGFGAAREVAKGADETSRREAEEYAERQAAGEGFMATSCCPAWTFTALKHIPELAPRVSKTGTPLHYAAAMARREFPEARIVFIGPCLAKRVEGHVDPNVDYVLTIEELGAMLVAKGVDVQETEPQEGQSTHSGAEPSREARLYAAAGGVAKAVTALLGEGQSPRLRCVDGIDREGIRELREIAKAPDSIDLLEVMSCEGGCIAGPQALANPKVALAQLKKAVEEGDGGGKP